MGRRAHATRRYTWPGSRKVPVLLRINPQSGILQHSDESRMTTFRMVWLRLVWRAARASAFSKG